ncbi:glycosyltransferase family 4 protein [Paenibacillus segetis]|uniref:Glycosyltransferase EpsD n=1 Tax=Paenibacillus segetis TaxID=1325360 RepID=A0ABQ1YMX9_9BACL|nr:glycosyltransferase family 4 protein [Paenibacillus segetis]GGH32145.1 putative glycosyltransferase EpsD [Paenibacillus segetis]
MSKKVLFCATVVSHLTAFHQPYLRWFKEQGWEVHAATHGESSVPYVEKQFNISIQRSPFKLDNLRAYIELKKIIDKNEYDIIHCHTPMGGVLTRLAARKARRRGTKVIYTAHGFHFFTGASSINWLVYYPVEKMLSRYTDYLITMNEEDYTRVLRRHFKAKNITFVHGVGIDFDKFRPVSAEEKRQLRSAYQIGQDKFVLIYAAELSKRKNQSLLFEVVRQLKQHIPNLQLLLAGQGDLEEYYKKMTHEMDLTDTVTFLGHRKDMDKIYSLADIAVSSSTQEGLPVNIMEAIASGLPVVATNVRGNRDLVEEGVHGFLIGLNDQNAFVKRVLELYASPLLREEIGKRRDLLTEKYSVLKVLNEVTPIYMEAVFKSQDSSITINERGGLGL